MLCFDCTWGEEEEDDGSPAVHGNKTDCPGCVTAGKLCFECTWEGKRDSMAPCEGSRVSFEPVPFKPLAPPAFSVAPIRAAVVAAVRRPAAPAEALAEAREASDTHYVIV